MPCMSRNARPRRASSTSGETASSASSISFQSAFSSTDVVMQSSMVTLDKRRVTLDCYTRGAAGSHMLVLAHADAQLEAVDGTPDPMPSQHMNPLERALQTHAGDRAQGRAGLRGDHDQKRTAAVRELREPFPNRIT